MRVLITGATGLIGSAILARLRRAGHSVVAVGRGDGPEVERLPTDRRIRLDLREALTPEAWRPHLAGIDAVVNCAGALQDNPRDSLEAVHAAAAAALFRACAAAGVRRVIQISAIGIDREAPTEFSRSKLAGDAALAALDLDWVILRPSVVVGRAAYGGNALFRGMAALPFTPMLPEAGLLQVVQLDEVALSVEILLRPGAPARLTLELAGPERLSFAAIVGAYRRWLGWRAAPSLALPDVLTRAAFALGDLAGRLGWRAPLRSTARIEIRRGATGDPSAWIKATGIEPLSLGEALASEPASVQERWFARLYPLKPPILVCLSLYWIATGLIALGPGFEAAVLTMQLAGLRHVAVPGVVAGALIDILIGIGIAFRRTARAALRAAIALSLVYLALATALLPSLWRDPLGPLVKIIPLMLLTGVALAILDER